MHTLYSLVGTEDPAKKDLYIKGGKTCANGLVALSHGESADFTTYFNAFSLKKWNRYTRLNRLSLTLTLEGSFTITYILLGEKGKAQEFSETVQNGKNVKNFRQEEMDGVILGFRIICTGEKGIVRNGAWEGDFDDWQEQAIGISITTFKRESYVRKTIAVIRAFQKEHEWLQLLVVDNGSTLPEARENGYQLIHNKNFGGSGGFTRGMIEYVDEKKVNYVLLMDDDIMLEPSVLERSHTLLCALKEKYWGSFLSGAMLSLEHPTMQYENTAYWDKIRLHGFGKGIDLTSREKLVDNEIILPERNRYGAWWYCAIPVKRIRDIGYPLPLFVKGDDMEYGIRNHREVLHMDGIGVWHQSFASKISPVVNYYSDRNMLIINNYAVGCGFLTFAAAVAGRIMKRLLQNNRLGLYCLYLALSDYEQGMTGLTKIPSDKKMTEILQKLKEPVPFTILLKLCKKAVSVVFEYSHTHDDYVQFRKQHLADSRFWKQFMM